MHLPTDELNRMITGKTKAYKFVTFQQKEDDKFPFWAIFFLCGKYYGASCQGKPTEKGMVWDEIIPGQVGCVELHRAAKMLTIYATVDDIYNPAMALIPLDLPFKKPAN